MKLIIGVDPDCSKSGVCILNKDLKTVHPKALEFFDLFALLHFEKENIEKVKIEGGWLNKMSNWHGAENVFTAAKIGKNIGANHETGKKIVEMCEYLRIPYIVSRPLTKKWKGRDGKITHDELIGILDNIKVKLTTKTTNQDTRDAVLIALF